MKNDTPASFYWRAELIFTGLLVLAMFAAAGILLFAEIILREVF